MNSLAPVFVALLIMMACLPNVSTEMPEEEAKAILEEKVLEICEDSNTDVTLLLLDAVEQSEAQALRVKWLFVVLWPDDGEKLEANVFPFSRPDGVTVSGSFVRRLQVYDCDLSVR